MFPALIAQWRRDFALPDLSFLWVQLAPYPWHDYSVLRQAQRSALALPNTAMATAIDLGDPTSPYSPECNASGPTCVSAGLRSTGGLVPLLHGHP